VRKTEIDDEESGLTPAVSDVNLPEFNAFAELVHSR